MDKQKWIVFQEIISKEKDVWKKSVKKNDSHSKSDFTDFLCQIGVIGHSIGKLIWLAKLGKLSLNYHQILFPKKGKWQKQTELRAKLKKKYSSLSFPFPFITVG